MFKNVIYISATDDFTMELKKHFGDYVKRDERRWKYADVDEDNVLNLEEFHMFFKPNKYAEMMDVVAMVTRLSRFSSLV